MTSKSDEKRIVAALQKDMLGRRGFRQNWDDIDDGVRATILRDWRVIVGHEVDVIRADERRRVLLEVATFCDDVAFDHALADHFRALAEKTQ